MSRADSPDALAPRWRGQPGRTEVWYATASDPAGAVGLWVHHELVAPVEGEPYAHGWVAVFRGVGAPVLERFGPQTVTGPAHSGEPAMRASVEDAVLDPPCMRGRAGRLAWDLAWQQSDEPNPLFTFPAWAWTREVLPAAQVVPVPNAPFAGVVRVDGTEHRLSDRARGNVAHIYGHGSAERWAWLHGALGDDDVLEIVSAVSRRPGLDRLPPLAFVQLRMNGRDWPRDPLLSAPLFRSRVGLPTWEVHGTVGRWRLRVEVTIPEERSVRVRYVDPDGSTATCANSEVADAAIVLEHRRTRWEVERRWSLRAGAHSEVGTRP